MSKEATNKRLFIASFLTLIAAGMGFAIRSGGVLAIWQEKFGFSKADVGEITGAAFLGFGVVIIVCSIFADRIGYKPIMAFAFILHIISAILTVAVTPLYESTGSYSNAYWCLFAAMFIFAIANGLCEAVINPLTAAMFPKKKTHYLNILHAGWPAGIILGGLLAYFFVGGSAAASEIQWEVMMCLFLIPTFVYGLLIFKEKFPESEASAAGVDFGTMLRQFAAPVLLFLLLLHAMVGYVELGTDSWITDIMENVISGKAVLLLVYTSAIMFVLRFFAGPIVEKINPIGLLFVSAVLGAVGLYALGSWTTGIWILVAATVYGVGKTFFWPTMLGVVGERFPKGGALAMGMMGGIGMLSAGLYGGPKIGGQQDYHATQKLKETVSEEVFEGYVLFKMDEETEKPILGSDGKPQVKGLDGKKVGAIKAKKKNNENLTDDEQKVLAAAMHGGQTALKITSAVPAVMAVGYLLLLFYFRSKGGYKAEVIHDPSAPGEEYTGGAEGPAEY